MNIVHKKIRRLRAFRKGLILGKVGSYLIDKDKASSLLPVFSVSEEDKPYCIVKRFEGLLVEVEQRLQFFKRGFRQNSGNSRVTGVSAFELLQEYPGYA